MLRQTRFILREQEDLARWSRTKPEDKKTKEEPQRKAVSSNALNTVLTRDKLYKGSN